MAEPTRGGFVPPPAPTRTRLVTVVAQDPGVRDLNGRIITTQLEIPAERVAPGPWGYRVQVIDYDGSTRTLYKEREYKADPHGDFVDPFVGVSNPRILGDPTFHAQNVYALAMRVLWRFEFALGRRVNWSFSGHQLKVAPHAFADANAFYSRDHEALMFGYFPGRKGTIFSCLSHDVVAHEATHALLDGLRVRYQDPSSADQAGFHEGFADVVALLSVFSLREVVAAILTRSYEGEGVPAQTRRLVRRVRGAKRPLIHRRLLTPQALRDNLLVKLAEEMGSELSGIRGQALRSSAKELTPSTKYKDMDEFCEPHRRGELLVAAMLNALLEVLGARFRTLGGELGDWLDLGRVVEDAADAADHLLTMAIRAIDYSLPVHMEFEDYLSALVTGDHEIRPADTKYEFRRHLLESFKAYGFEPSSKGRVEPGLWLPPERPDLIVYDRTHFESMTRDRDEVFRFVWENRGEKQLNLADGVYTRVLSVRPCLRVNPDDGFALRESVAEYYQQVTVEARELRRLGLRKPRDMPNDTAVTLYGGGTLVFDEYGRLKFNINNRLLDARRQQKRLEYLWGSGSLSAGATRRRGFSYMHRRRATGMPLYAQEMWHGPAPHEESADDDDAAPDAARARGAERWETA